MTLSRRRFLRTGAAAAAALSLPGALEALCARMAHGRTLEAEGYGALLPDPAGLLDLPAGFRYRAFSMARLGATDDPRWSGRLSDGDPVPCMHDGMGAFRGAGGRVVLVRNHEVDLDDGPVVDPARARPYDPLCGGGTTTLWVDGERRPVRAFASLSGTARNCAGGVTPWGSWLSAEECTYMPGPSDPVNADRTDAVSRPHGYVFEVPAAAEGLVEPVPIRAMGRFYHEAVAVDPVTAFVYLSEDRDDGLFYRYRPDVLARGTRRIGDLRPGDLARGGTLEALRIVKRPQARTDNHEAPAFTPGRRWAVDWVAIDDVEPECDMERDPSDPAPDPLARRHRAAPGSTRAQGLARGAARFTRVEGVTWHRRAIYFCATNGGPEKAGQVWRLDLSTSALDLVVEPNRRAVLEGPDNLAPAPNGDVLVCEDGRDVDHVRGITPDGRLYPIARNALNTSEVAGACFAPDGRTLFVNVQEPGITFAIWGPWERRRL